MCVYVCVREFTIAFKTRPSSDYKLEDKVCMTTGNCHLNLQPPKYTIFEDGNAQLCLSMCYAFMFYYTHYACMLVSPNEYNNTVAINCDPFSGVMMTSETTPLIRNIVVVWVACVNRRNICQYGYQIQVLNELSTNTPFLKCVNNLC
jgi:hypothetical protein